MKWVEAVSGASVRSTVAVPPAGTVTSLLDAVRVSVAETDVVVGAPAVLLSVRTSWAGSE